MSTTRRLHLPLLTFLALSGCAESFEPHEDAGPILSQPYPTIDVGLVQDAGAPELDLDAGEPLPEDLDGGSEVLDAGAPPEADASTRVDAGAPTPVDAGPPPPVPDAGAPDAGCLPDGLEENDTPETAALVATGSGWPTATFPLTWSPGDAADWIRAELDSTDIVGLFRIHASDSDSRSMVEVRATCQTGVIVCRGSGAERVGATCIGRRMFNAYIDVACNTPSPAAVDILVGVERGERPCEHTTRVSLSPAAL